MLFFLNDGARYCPRPHWRLNKRAHVRARTRAGELPTGRLKQPSYAQPNALLPVTALVTSRVVLALRKVLVFSCGLSMVSSVLI